jgi:hypothetical protein
VPCTKAKSTGYARALIKRFEGGATKIISKERTKIRKEVIPTHLTTPHAH